MSSTALPWSEGVDMIEAYRDLPVFISNESGARLEGFRISKEAILNILNKVPTYPIPHNPEVYGPCQEIGVMFAIRPSSTHPGEKVFTLVVAGIDNNNLLIRDTVYEYCEPIPPATPLNFP